MDLRQKVGFVSLLIGLIFYLAIEKYTSASVHLVSDKTIIFSAFEFFGKGFEVWLLFSLSVKIQMILGLRYHWLNWLSGAIGAFCVSVLFALLLVVGVSWIASELHIFELSISIRTREFLILMVAPFVVLAWYLVDALDYEDVF